MERTLIALWGVTNSGKSTTLNYAHEELLECDGVIEIRSGKRRPGSKDIRNALLEKDGVTIGILSIAEPPRKLKEKLEALAKECDVIVCATRSDGETVTAVESMKDEGFTLHWIEKKKSASVAERERDNRKEAKEVVRAVIEAVERGLDIGRCLSYCCSEKKPPVLMI